MFATRERVNPSAGIWYREPLVWLVIVIPASAVIMGILMVSLAVISNDGLVVDDYYKKGLEINRSLERDLAAANYGLGGILRLDRDRRTIKATLRWGKGFNPPTKTLRLGLFHATRSGFDHELLLQRMTLDEYASATPKLLPGRWYLQIEANDWRLTGTFNVPGSNEIRLRASRPAASYSSDQRETDFK